MVRPDALRLCLEFHQLDLRVYYNVSLVVVGGQSEIAPADIEYSAVKQDIELMRLDQSRPHPGPFHQGKIFPCFHLFAFRSPVAKACPGSHHSLGVFKGLPPGRQYKSHA